ncbi:DNA repair protein RadC [Paenibacillus thermoaerophilus]|uniref:DNA repair protein RadC n=1 Tax=Paenibacillus thermoaerophilus TaxID=1215385 RepID=A0ABW2UYP5_9BACL|nr:DNA repair protein RadC [Paenibacillus thermoaerophilus]TMV17279.1 JAB domain-containing protein [Paenibacillus thermoaerophilus]
MEYNGLTLREMPQEERPRERMLAQGAKALSNAELLAVLLRTGSVRESAVTLAQRLLAEAGGLRGLAERTTEELTRLRGIGVAKALQVQAGIELGRRLSAAARESAPVLRAPRDVAELLMEELRFLRQEHFVVLYLNTKNRLIGKETLSVGSLNATVVHPREVFRSAILRSAASIICAHNHPSGDPEPSREDVLLTRRLAEAGELIGIRLLDHVVIGDHRFSSLKEQGHL